MLYLYLVLSCLGNLGDIWDGVGDFLWGKEVLWVLGGFVLYILLSVYFLEV
jgi:hypothetical protein